MNFICIGFEGFANHRFFDSAGVFLDVPFCDSYEACSKVLRKVINYSRYPEGGHKLPT